ALGFHGRPSSVKFHATQSTGLCPGAFQYARGDSKAHFHISGGDPASIIDGYDWKSEYGRLDAFFSSIYSFILVSLKNKKDDHTLILALSSGSRDSCFQ
ncbi:MAG TPA: hypothetical protein PK876_05420, partial [Elusimicrobiota bacterium]|nr:hypothetical protein [Elusimicrobiota bacterium]